MAVSPVVIKAVITAATDKRTWKALAILLAAIFMPLILLILMIAAMFSGVESANNNLLDYSFAGAAIPSEFTDEQRGAIEDMREWFGELNDIISEKENAEECSFDGNMVRAVFYCLNFGGELGEDFDFGQFCECFDGLSFGQLDTALEIVSERFPQACISVQTTMKEALKPQNGFGIFSPSVDIRKYFGLLRSRKIGASSSNSVTVRNIFPLFHMSGRNCICRALPS